MKSGNPARSAWLVPRRRKLSLSPSRSSPFFQFSSCFNLLPLSGREGERKTPGDAGRGCFVKQRRANEHPSLFSFLDGKSSWMGRWCGHGRTRDPDLCDNEMPSSPPGDEAPGGHLCDQWLHLARPHASEKTSSEWERRREGAKLLYTPETAGGGEAPADFRKATFGLKQARKLLHLDEI